MQLEQISGGGGGPRPADKGYRFADPKPLAATVTVFMWIYLAGTAAAFAAVLYELVALSRQSPAARLDTLVSVTGDPTQDLIITGVRLVAFVIYIITAILFLKWNYRVVKNARVMTGGRGMTATPGWAIGWYFVPIAFLWKPFEYMRQAWQAATNPTSPSTVEVPGFMRWWWGLWLITVISDNISGQLGNRADTVGMYMVSDVLELISKGIDLPLVIIVVKLLRELSARQHENQDVSVFD